MMDGAVGLAITRRMGVSLGVVWGDRGCVDSAVGVGLEVVLTADSSLSHARVDLDLPNMG